MADMVQMSRCYLHFEEGEPAHTLALALDAADAGPLSRALDAFVASYNAAHPARRLAVADLGIVDGAGAVLRLSAPLLACVGARGDLFVRRAAGLPPAPAAPPGPLRPAARPLAANRSPPAATVAGSSARADSAAEQAAQIKALVAQGEAAFKAKRYRAASVAYEAVLARNPRHRASLSRLAEIETECERFEEAAAFLEVACDAARATAHSAPTTPLLLARLAETYLTLQRPREAVGLVREALELCPEGEGGEAGEGRRARLLVLLGRALYAAGERKAGADLFMAVLEKDGEQPEALAAYAAAALECGQLEDALKVNLRLIVKRPEHTPTRKALAATVAADDGCAHLFEQLAPSASAASAHAFLATVVKEHSQLEASERLYRVAVAHAPAAVAASYCLNLMHVLQLSLQQEEAMGVLLAYLRKQGKDRAIGTGGLGSAAIVRCLEESGALSQPPPFPPPAEEPAAAHSGAPAAAEGAPLPPAVLPGAGEDLPKSGPLSAAGAAPGAAAATVGGPGAEGGGGGYSAADLDFLALLMTACKLLFLQGRLAALPALVNAIEPARVGRSLHLTLIRNEHAYFCCLAQLLPSLQAAAPSLALPAHDRVLHVLADSHCLPYGWRLIRPRGERVLLRPLLVTGLKAWHLREASDFFPKANFWHAVSALPLGGRAVALFGEIDCREALLLCVERKRYGSVEEGALAVIAVYLAALRKAAKARQLERLWVHAVPPVLNETRPVVRLFNGLLKRKARAPAQAPAQPPQTAAMSLCPSRCPRASARLTRPPLPSGPFVRRCARLRRRAGRSAGSTASTRPCSTALPRTRACTRSCTWMARTCTRTVPHCSRPRSSALAGHSPSHDGSTGRATAFSLGGLCMSAAR